MKTTVVRFCFVIIGILLCGSIFFCQNEETTVDDLRCESLINPIAVEAKIPLLSWKIESAQRNKKQSAYRILVASSLSLLNEKEADYWDSGKVNTNQSVNIKYQGKELSSRKELFWKVMIWDEKGQTSSWSESAAWSMGLLDASDWDAQWITNREDLYPDSTLTFPAPYFRKQFEVGKKIKHAKVYVSGLGFYELYLNGEKVGDHVMAPVVSNYDKRVLRNVLYYYDDQSTQRVYYNTFDVTEQLQRGKNALGVILGNGWYNQRARTVEGWMWYSTPRLLLQLEVEYVNGSVEKIITNETWKTKDSPLLYNSIFVGEVYDARLACNAWNETEYDDRQWEYAKITRAPSGALYSQLAPADKLIRTLPMTLKEQLNDSTYLYELPEMISGWVELRVKGKAGSAVRLKFIGEEGGDFGQQDVYVLKGKGIERWEPKFTWHAFRFVEVVAPDVTLDENSLLAKVVHTSVERVGDFSCSNELFNKLFEAYIRTQEANFHGSISSDCPHRERLGYTGDGQVLTESSILLFDMRRFYIKWLDDMEDARNKNSGYVPHTAPFGGGGGGPAWGSAFLLVPWTYYTYYQDKTVLEKYYEGMSQWVSYLETRTDEQGLIVQEEPSGWCLGDWCLPNDPDNIQLPESLVNTCYYYHCADLMSRIAKLLEKTEDYSRFRNLAQKIKNDFNAKFFNSVTNHYWEGHSGADVFPLAFGLVPSGKEKEVFDALLNHLEEIDYHFDTGFLGTPLLVNVLTDYRRDDIAYRIMNQRSFPSFSYLLDPAYSTLWERWDGKESRCHPFFGSVVSWFYKALAGINLEENKLIIAPQVVGDLTFCRASYQSPYGLIHSSYFVEETNVLKVKMFIPANLAAEVYLPATAKSTIKESGNLIPEQKKLVALDKPGSGRIKMVLGSGEYHFIITNFR
ncbi:MAG: family 78 glycoside hydrolase catalytic domain [Massilibacteroides sp.]|nr:family 78 glycoside hydrolase catalytic domain [Massilibacteroides sp.]